MLGCWLWDGTRWSTWQQACSRVPKVPYCAIERYVLAHNPSGARCVEGMGSGGCGGISRPKIHSTLRVHSTPRSSSLPGRWLYWDSSQLPCLGSIVDTLHSLSFAIHSLLLHAFRPLFLASLGIDLIYLSLLQAHSPHLRPPGPRGRLTPRLRSPIREGLLITTFGGKVVSRQQSRGMFTPQLVMTN
jgi:hypothetical protein